jgi:CheY-like chemotaxis protein
LSVRSKVGQGTQVTLYLPRSRAPITVVTAETRTDSPGHGETVLVVEDNEDVRTVAISLLEQLNYRTVTAGNAKAALDILEGDTPIDLVFSDVMLPGDIDGIGLAKAVTERHPHLPVLLTSGYAKALVGRHGLPILRKPYQISALAEAVRAALDTRRPRAGGAHVSQ